VGGKAVDGGKDKGGIDCFALVDEWLKSTGGKRPKSIGTRVSEQEYAHLERVAQKDAKTLAEWCRELMLNSANGGAAETAVAGARAEALMAEVVALRTILLNVLFKRSNSPMENG
jgi:hypothetical protein